MDEPRILVPQELFAPAESSSFVGDYELPLLKAGPDLFEFSEPLHWKVTVSNTGDALLVAGTIEGVARTSCARCLEGFDFPVLGEVEGYYLLSNESIAPEDMDEDEFEYLPKDDTIDLVPLLQAALLLELPLVPLCDENCEGLCMLCGQNLNEGDCSCEPTGEETEKPNPFAVLKDFPFASENE